LSIFELYSDATKKIGTKLNITPDGRKHSIEEHTMPYSKIYNIIVAPSL